MDGATVRFPASNNLAMTLFACSSCIFVEGGGMEVQGRVWLREDPVSKNILRSSKSELSDNPSL